MSRRTWHGQSYDQEDRVGDGRATLLEALQGSPLKRPVAPIPAGEGARPLSGSGGTFPVYCAPLRHEALSPFYRKEFKAAQATCPIPLKMAERFDVTVG